MLRWVYYCKDISRSICGFHLPSSLPHCSGGSWESYDWLIHAGVPSPPQSAYELPVSCKKFLLLAPQCMTVHSIIDFHLLSITLVLKVIQFFLYDTSVLLYIDDASQLCSISTFLSKVPPLCAKFVNENSKKDWSQDLSLRNSNDNLPSTQQIPFQHNPLSALL